MSSGRSVHTESASQDFELNLAPIIDCFTVLITFMLVTASFLTVGILDAGSAVISQASSDAPPTVVIEVQLQDSFASRVKLSGKSNQTFNFSAKDGSWDFEALEKNLRDLKTKWPTVDSVVLSATDTTEYLQIIKSMERIHKIFPGIVLGGY